MQAERPDLKSILEGIIGNGRDRAVTVDETVNSPKAEREMTQAEIESELRAPRSELNARAAGANARDIEWRRLGMIAKASSIRVVGGAREVTCRTYRTRVSSHCIGTDTQ
jgi:hypothetical protein